jgi:hypothetical protein
MRGGIAPVTGADSADADGVVRVPFDVAVIRGILLVAVDDGLDLVDRAGSRAGVEAQDQRVPADARPVLAVVGVLAVDESEPEPFEEQAEFGGRAFAEESSGAVAAVRVESRPVRTGGEDQHAAVRQQAARLERELEQFRVRDMHEHGDGEHSAKLAFKRRCTRRQGEVGLRESQACGIRKAGVCGLRGFDHGCRSVNTRDRVTLAGEERGVASHAAADLDYTGGRCGQVPEQEPVQSGQVSSRVGCGELRSLVIVRVDGLTVHCGSRPNFAPQGTGREAALL